ncbi:hypothetical protein [Candidatus Igneacidithiobacillus taiwanensis]|uniref:hypothetical protein n=1 Tax=Candidatus Igneacidithiobacillus taiwanensis TaxID=1945924 RepID=UPI00289C98A3|nr:hypothetical protein [Candidatus Igneacidithiobacillus taiwanensis]
MRIKVVVAALFLLPLTAFGTCQYKMLINQPFNAGGGSGKDHYQLQVFKKNKNGVCYKYANIISDGVVKYALSAKDGPQDADPATVASFMVIRGGPEHDLLGYDQILPAGMYSSEKFTVYDFSHGIKKIVFQTKGEGQQEGFEVKPTDDGFTISGAYVGQGQSEATAGNASATWKWDEKSHHFVLISNSTRALKFASIILQKPVDPALVSWWRKRKEGLQ